MLRLVFTFYVGIGTVRLNAEQKLIVCRERIVALGGQSLCLIGGRTQVCHCRNDRITYIGGCFQHIVNTVQLCHICFEGSGCACPSRR